MTRCQKQDAFDTLASSSQKQDAFETLKQVNMILDKLENSFLYLGVNERMKRAFEYLKSTNFGAMESGKYAVDGDEIIAIVNSYEPKIMADCKSEAHKKYLDIQFMVSGSELMGYALLEDQAVSIAYNAEKDIVFFDCETSIFEVKEGMFVVFYPNDIHRPSITTGKLGVVRKVVMKVLFDANDFA